jgi:hypothetical protein
MNSIYQGFVEQAVSLKRQYDTELIHLMTQHGGQAEVEVTSLPVSFLCTIISEPGYPLPT